MPSKRAKPEVESDAMEATGDPMEADYDPSEPELTPEALEQLMADLDASVEARCQRIRDELDRQKLELLKKYNIEKARLPRNVRRMTLKKFIDDFGENATAILVTAIQGKPAGHAQSDLEDDSSDQPQTVLKGTRQKAEQQPVAFSAVKSVAVPTRASTRHSTRNMPMETPSKSSAAGIVLPTPGTAARLARRGETVLSMNGSPVVVFPDKLDTSSAAESALGSNYAEGHIGLLQRGLQTIAQNDVDRLCAHAKQTTKGQLQSLQDQIAQLMDRLG